VDFKPTDPRYPGRRFRSVTLQHKLRLCERALMRADNSLRSTAWFMRRTAALAGFLTLTHAWQKDLGSANNLCIPKLSLGR
jgi:hypothetical protein